MEELGILGIEMVHMEEAMLPVAEEPVHASDIENLVGSSATIGIYEEW